MTNIPNSVKAKIGLNLHNKLNHPLCIVKDLIVSHFKNKFKQSNIDISVFDDMNPIASTVDNFDLLRIPENHPSRSQSDTYYIDETHVLRTHTSAHQNELLSKGLRSFLVIGDVYRKDQVDRFHYPVFHQMEGVHIVDASVDPEVDLKETLGSLAKYLFPGKEFRFNNDYFPFTEPSFEMEVKFGDKWLEILGCGVIHHDILDKHGIQQKGWAFGFGLERICMILFNIPDIRLFWKNSEKFLVQFNSNEVLSQLTKADGKITEFKPYSSLDSVNRDISFWINEKDITIDNVSNEFKWNKINEFYEMVRELCGDNIENVNLYDKFFHKKTLKYSHTFRLTFSADIDMNNPGLFKKAVDSYMTELYTKLPQLEVILR